MSLVVALELYFELCSHCVHCSLASYGYGTHAYAHIAHACAENVTSNAIEQHARFRGNHALHGKRNGSHSGGHLQFF